MRILVFSDTHREIERCIKTIENIIGVDLILHAGDHLTDGWELFRAFPQIPIEYVKGNCDFKEGATELIIEAEGKKIFLTHGHFYNVKSESDYNTLKEYAKEKGCDMAVFGHTHIPYNENFGDFSLLNPGSAKYNRTFGVIEIENGKIKSAVCDLL